MASLRNNGEILPVFKIAPEKKREEEETLRNIGFVFQSRG